AGKDVVPAARVEPRRMLLELVEDLVHLESGEDGLDQHGSLDRRARNAELVLRHHEDVVPQTRLEMTLELRKIEVGTAAARDELPRVVEEVEREIEDAARDRLPVDRHVLLRQMPAARAHEQGSDLLVQLVSLPIGAHIVDAAAYRVAQVDVALDQVVPLRRVGVLEVGHEDLRAGNERVDDHLPSDRTGDLDAAVLDVGGNRRAGPVGLAYGARLGKKFGQLAGIELALARGAAREKLGAAAAEGALQLRSKSQSFRRQYFG